MSLCPIYRRYLFISHAHAHSCIVLQFILLHVSKSIDSVSPLKFYLPMAPKKHVPKCNHFPILNLLNHVAFEEDFSLHSILAE